MSQAYPTEKALAFAASREHFEATAARLQSADAGGWEHSALEDFLEAEGQELLRRMAQDYLDLRGAVEAQWGRDDAVVGRDNVVRTVERDGTTRPLMLKFGVVQVTRRAHERRDGGRLCPLDAELNLPVEVHSHGVRKRVAVQTSRVSFAETVGDLKVTGGARVGQRQVEELAVRAAQDFELFYQQRNPERVASSAPLLVVSVDGKGVPVRRTDLREETRKEAERLSRTAQTGAAKVPSRRMATVAAVYSIERFKRTAQDVSREFHGVEDASVRPKRPRPQHKRVWASVIESAAAVVDSAMDEAHRRDPSRAKEWVALVDGNEHQLDCLTRRAASDGVDLCIVLDLLHVLVYLWAAGKDLCANESERRAWVRVRLHRLLMGRVVEVASGMRRSATKRGLVAADRKHVDVCADYLLKYQDYLRYDEYLARGLPIASGVIEGACRHLVKDRMELTGARWRLPRAEAILRLRALRSSGDFEEYWSFHLLQERERNHLARYQGPVPQLARPVASSPKKRRGHLSRVK